MIQLPAIPKLSDHGNEIALLALIAIGVITLLIVVALWKLNGWDISACLLVLQSIVSAIKERWTQRTVDRMGQQLAESQPTAAIGSGA